MGQFITTRGRSGSTAVTQATVPWVVEGFTGMTALTVTVSGTSAVTQSTSPWIVAGGGSAGSAASGVVTVQGIASMTPLLVTGTGTAGTAATGVVTVQGIASGTAVAVSGTITATPATSATATLTNVAASATSVQLLASTAGRKQATFFNDSAAVLYLKFGTTASATSFTVRLTSNAYYELPATCYTGRIDGIWASATGTVRITELT